ncbi:MAG TPA: hypothetical protein VJJ26_04580 [Candidatus Babeliales bacterium]|nr:hypothetical protein [Candidatus Babeliales bacterium]
MSENLNDGLPSYCCGALDYQIESAYCPIQYSKRWREYSIRDFKSTSISVMVFCPNCATEFPTSLRTEWFDILEQEYGLEDPTDDDKKKVPKEFLTEDWWKNRELEDNKNKCIDSTRIFGRPIRCLE